MKNIFDIYFKTCDNLENLNDEELVKDDFNDQSLELRYIMRFIEKKSFDLCASKIKSLHGDLRKSFEIMSNSIKFKMI